MAKSKLIDSFNYAIAGMMHVLKSQRNMRLHFLVALLVLLFGIYLNLSGLELLIILVSITFVLCAEMFNTAIEYTINLITDEKNPKLGMIKDISAGAVLVAALNALIVGYVLFSYRLNVPFDDAVLRIKQSPWYVTFIALILVFGLVILAKLILRSGTPLRGGMPSGHAAFAFAIWTAIFFLADNDFVIILTFILAFMVARSRVISAIHNLWEAVSGALIGTLITTLIFQVLK